MEIRDTDTRYRTENGRKEYIGYEYREITADMEKAAFLLDCYENFGWEQDERFPETFQSPGKKKIMVHLKRNRKIINKMELTRLQRNFEACIKEIAALEEAKTSKATAYSLLIGFLGTVFMAGAVFAITADQPSELGCILLSLPGIAGWVAPCFVYKYVAGKQAEKLEPLIETKFNEIYEICEKGHKLLN